VSKIKKWAEIIVPLVGGWWSLMSGTISIPFAFLALIFGGKSAVWFALLAVAALWVVIIRMACDNYKTQNKRIVSIMLSYYFKELDATISLLKTYKQSNDIVKAGDLIIEQAELCNEIRIFIGQNISPIDAAIFGGQNDKKELSSAISGAVFWETWTNLFHEKLIKMKDIMQK
jgi:hypothetical protein